jgi:Rieske [2Fe-2S] domain
MAETCSHFSGPLSEGKLVDGSIECPYHASRFALEDGRVINGPAVHRQPCLEIRIREGQIEVRKPPLVRTAFALCDLTHFSVRVGPYPPTWGACHPVSTPFRFRGSVLSYRSRDIGSTDFDE